MPDDAVGLLQEAKRLGLRPIGVTFHVGSQATDLHAWQKAISKAQSIIQQSRAAGIDISLINLGGGFPVQYSPEDPTLAGVASVINEAIGSSSDIQYMAEPGRFLVADSSVIVATIIGVEDRHGRTWLYLDVGSFHAFMEVFEFNRFPYPVHSLSHILEGIGPKGYKDYVLTGPSCDSYDTLSLGITLPDDLSIGDKLLITMTGAYTVVYGSEFNGFKVPPRRFISSHDVAHGQTNKEAVYVS